MAVTSRKKKIVKLSKCNDDELPKLRNIPISEVSKGVSSFKTSTNSERDRVSKIWFRDQRREINKINNDQHFMYRRLLKFNKLKHQALKDFWKRESKEREKIRDDEEREHSLKELMEVLKEKQREMDKTTRPTKSSPLPPLNWGDTNVIDHVLDANKPKEKTREANVLVINKKDFDQPDVLKITDTEVAMKENDEEEDSDHDDEKQPNVLKTDIDKLLRNKIKSDFGYSMMLKRHKIMERHFGEPGEFERDFTMYKQNPNGTVRRIGRGRPEAEVFDMPSYREKYLLDKRLRWEVSNGIANDVKVSQFCQKVTKNVVEKEKIAKESRRPVPPPKRMKTMEPIEFSDTQKFRKAMELAEMMKPPSELDPDSADALKYCRYLREYGKEQKQSKQRRLSNWSKKF